MINEFIPKEERTWAMISHLSSFSGVIFPLGNILAPLVIWLVQRDGMPFVDDQAKEALNFQISIIIYVMVSLIGTMICIGWFTLIATGLLWLILPIIAGVKANEGEPYRYPFCLRFV